VLVTTVTIIDTTTTATAATTAATFEFLFFRFDLPLFVYHRHNAIRLSEA
jgi:hypothetical protein